MINFAKKAVLTLAAGLLIAPAGSVVALTREEYLNIIKTRCETTKQLIDEQRRSDLVARINKGRAYQSIIDEQTAFSLRLRNNRLSSENFDRQIAAIEDGVNRFRSAYNRYDDSVDALLNIDCQTKPAEFADQLQLARSLRQIIGNEVATVDTELAKYRQAMVEFKSQLESQNNPVAGDP